MLKTGKILLLEHPDGVINLNGVYSLEPSQSERFHIYVITNDEIKDGDWRLDIRTNEIYKSNEQDSKLYDNTFRKKIISTTDTSLTRTNAVGNDGFMFDDSSTIMPDFPQPSSSFLTRLVKNLNSKDEEAIDEVLIEYITESELKIKPDNTITIKKLKDCWDKREFNNIIQSFAERFVTNIENSETQKEVSDWVAANLK